MVTENINLALSQYLLDLDDGSTTDETRTALLDGLKAEGVPERVPGRVYRTLFCSITEKAISMAKAGEKTRDAAWKFAAAESKAMGLAAYFLGKGKQAAMNAAMRFFIYYGTEDLVPLAKETYGNVQGFTPAAPGFVKGLYCSMLQSMVSNSTVLEDKAFTRELMDAIKSIPEDQISLLNVDAHIQV